MSWDIYGNPLRRGYCEVHPDVHQEYPCSICMAKNQQQSQPHNELEQLQYEFAQQGDYIRHLESEMAALAATVEALRKALLPFASTGLPTLVNGENYSVMHDRVKDWFGVSEFVRAIECFNATPQQHLAEIRAQAGRAGFVAGYFHYKHYGFQFEEELDAASDKYAEQIRREVEW